MSNGLNKPGIRAEQRGLSNRVTGLEQNVARILFGVNQRFQGLDQRVASQEEIVSALADLAGIEELERIINEKRIKRAREQAAFEKSQLEEGVSDGYVLATDTIGEKSVIVVRYADVAGNVVEPGRAQLALPGVQPQFKDKLLGGKAGLKLDLPDGGTVEVLEIYNVDEAKAKAVEEAKATAAASAAAAAAKAAEAVATADETADKAAE